MFKQGAIRKVQPSKGEFFKQLIPSIKEGWVSKTSDKFEATECIYNIPYFNFKTKGMQNLKYMLKKGDLKD